MINVTDKFKENITKPRMIDAKINYDNIELTAEDDINHIERIFNAGLFKTCMKGLNIDINKRIDSNVLINAKSGIYVNNSFEYVPLGNYKTHEPKRNEDTEAYTVEAYDKIEESMIDYDLQVNYPITVKEMFVKIFERLGWDTSYIPETFINSSKMINKDVWSGINYTFRDCLDELCTITCQWLIEKDNNIKLIQPTITNQEIDQEFFCDTNVQIKELVFFNALIFSRVDDVDLIDRKDDESISKNGLKAFKVKDNQLLSTNDRSDFIDEMWNYIKDFKYYSYDCQTNGIMFLEPLDQYIINLNDIKYETILLEDSLDITSDISEQISAEKCEESETNLKYSSQTDKEANMATLYLDKQNRILQALISTVSETTKNVTTKKTAKGNPIIVEDAGPYALEDLKIYGSTKQETQILPNEYTQVEYLESSGTQYIDTQILGNNNSKVDITFEPLDSGDKYYGIFGARNTTNSNSRLTLSYYGSTKALAINYGLTNTNQSDVSITKKSNIVLGNSKLVIDKIERLTFNTPIEEDINQNFTIFTFMNTSGATYTKSSIKLYSCDIYDNDKLVRRFIPCLRNEDNKPGLYDLVENKFYINSGSGEFVYGDVAQLPNPTYPCEIQNVEDLNIKLTGKNILNNSLKSQEINGLTVTVNEDKSVLINGTATTRTTLVLQRNIKFSSKAILSGCPDGGAKNKYYMDYTNNVNRAYFDIGDNIEIEQFSETYANTAIDIVILEGTTCSNLLFKPMVRAIDIEDDTYDSYKEKIYPITIKDKKLCKIGDYQDYLYKKEDKWYFHKEINQFILNGDENWLKQYVWSNVGNNTNAFYLAWTQTHNAVGDTLNTICTHFKTTKNIPIEDIIEFQIGVTTLIFRMDKSIGTANDFKQWLKDQYNAGTPVIVQYVLATPVEEEITDETLIEQLNSIFLFEGYNCLNFIDKYNLINNAEVTYLTDSILNEQYATKTELKMTEDNINLNVNSTKKELTESINNVDSKVDDVNVNFNDFKDNEYVKSINNLQKQIDGAIQFWKGYEEPTLNNAPAIDWKTNTDKDNHIGDIYYLYKSDENDNTMAMNGYRFDFIDNKYQWILLSDTELAAVQELAQQALDKSTQVENDLKENYSTTSDMQTEIDIKTSAIESSVSNVQKSVDSNNETINSLREQFTSIQTSTSQQFSILEQRLEDGVETLKNGLVTITINGIQVSTNLSKISTLITNDTFAIQDTSGTYLAYFGYDEKEGRSKSEMDNLTIHNFFIAGAHRQEKFVDSDTGEVRTGWAYIGGDF